MKKWILFLSSISLANFALADDEFIPYHSINFATPSKNIVCGGDVPAKNGEKAWHGVSCYVTQIEGTPPIKRPKDCEFDWGQEFVLGRTGKPEMTCYSDYSYHLNPPILAYGKTIRGKGWQCSSSEKGMRCENSQKHGFEISRKQQRFF